MTKLYHPRIKGVTVNANADTLASWLASGWLENDPYAPVPAPEPEPDETPKPAPRKRAAKSKE